VPERPSLAKYDGFDELDELEDELDQPDEPPPPRQLPLLLPLLLEEERLQFWLAWLS
jgi:hypothetical protein